MSRRGRPRHSDILTPREWEVLALLREGLSNPEIADRLNISRAGAKYHVAEILGKLGLESRDEAARWQPEAAARPWWAVAAAPIELLVGPLRRLPAWASAAIGGAALIAAAGGLTLLAVLLVRSSDGDGAFAIGADVSLPVTPTVELGTQAIFALDVRTGELDRLPVPVPNNVTVGVAPEMSADGSTFAYLGDGRGLLYDKDGNERELNTLEAGGVSLGWAPDGKTMLFGGSDGLKTVDAERGGVEFVLRQDVQDAAFSPDGSRIALISEQRLGVLDVATGELRMIAPELQASYLPFEYGPGHLAWSPDGERIAFGDWRAEEPITQGWSDVYVVNADGTGLRRLTDSPRAKRNFSWSTDGKRIAYVHSLDEGDQVEVVDIETGVVSPSGALLNVSRPSPWVAPDELLAGGNDGIVLVGVDGALRSLVAATRECNHLLLGRVESTIYFLTACSEPGL